MERLRIRDLREDSDLSQTQIAELLNTSQTVYSRYERDERSIPINYLIKLAKYYNVSLDYICGLTNEKKPLHELPVKTIENRNNYQERRASL